MYRKLSKGEVVIFKPLSDELEAQINTLQNLLKKSNSAAQKKLIQTDLKRIENGYKSEKENAYYLDFEFENSKNIIVLHDIRIEHKGRTAQIDHILISRVEVSILESKSFSGELTIKDDGSLLVNYGRTTETFPNPIEQNNRHMKVLEELINDKFNLQANTKLFGGISFISKILINPKTTLRNKKLPEGFERADSFATKRSKEIDKMNPMKVLGLASKMMTIDKAKELAKFLIQNNKPVSFDYSKKYRIKSNDNLYVQEKPITYEKKIETPSNVHQTVYECIKCKSQNLEVNYGRNYYFKCLDCKNNIPIKHTCNTPNCKPKTKKRKLQFFKICEACGIDELFYENKA